MPSKPKNNARAASPTSAHQSVYRRNRHICLRDPFTLVADHTDLHVKKTGGATGNPNPWPRHSGSAASTAPIRYACPRVPPERPRGMNCQAVRPERAPPASWAHSRASAAQGVLVAGRWSRSPHSRRPMSKIFCRCEHLWKPQPEATEPCRRAKTFSSTPPRVDLAVARSLSTMSRYGIRWPAFEAGVEEHVVGRPSMPLLQHGLMTLFRMCRRNRMTDSSQKTRSDGGSARRIAISAGRLLDILRLDLDSA